MTGPVAAMQEGSPVGWEWVPLKRAAAINTTVLPEDTDPDYTFRYIDIASVNSDGSLGELTALRFEDAPSRARRVVRAGDVIVSTVRTYLRAIARIPSDDVDLVCSTGFAVLTARPQVNPRFLYWWTRSSPLVEEVVARSVGVGYPAVAPEELGRIPTPLPPLPEQEAIADFLLRETARIDEGMAADGQLAALLAERADSVGSVWAQDCFDRFGSGPLRRFAGQIEQGWSPAVDASPAEPSEWGILKTSGVSSGSFRPEENKRLPGDVEPDLRWMVRKGDLLVTRGSGSLSKVGRAAVAEPGEWHLLLPDLLYRVQLAVGEATFVASVLSTPQVRAFIESRVRTDAGQTLKIRRDDLAEVPIPRADSEQQLARVRALVKELSLVLQASGALRQQLELLAERRQALITAAVSGQIDVTEQARSAIA